MGSSDSDILFHLYLGGLDGYIFELQFENLEPHQLFSGSMLCLLPVWIITLRGFI